jgi:type IV pilus assembly protein PilM
MTVILDIGTWKVRLFSGEKLDKGFYIDDLFEFKTENSVLKGVFASGEVNSGYLKQIISGFPKKYTHKISRVIIPDQFVTFKFSEIAKPLCSDEKEKSFLGWRIKESLPPSLTSYSLIDFQITQIIEKDTGPSGQILSILIKEEFLNTLAEVFNEIKVIPDFYEVNSINEANLYDYLIESKRNVKFDISQSDKFNIEKKDLAHTENYCVMHIGNFCCNMTFFINQKPVFSRVFDRAGYHLTQNISNYLNIDFSAAEMRKHSDSFLPENKKFYESNDFSYDFFQHVFGEFFKEIEMTIRSFESKHSDEKFTKLIIFGGGSLTKGLSNFLTRLLNVNCTVFELEKNYFTMGKKVKDNLNINEFAACLGSLAGV